MSGITQCPACGTLFRVLDEQLAVSKGWVRCGQCHEVFDAASSLTDAPNGVAETAGSGSHAGHGDVVQSVGGEISAEARASSVRINPTGAEQRDARLALPLPASSDSESGWAVEPAQILAAPEADSAPAGLPQIDSAAATASPPQETVLAANQTVAPEPAPATETEATVSFMAMPSVPKRRWPWVLAGFALAIALAAQSLWFWREALAVRWPATTPALSQACAWIGCRVDAPQLPEALSVEAATVRPIGPGTYRVSLTLKNRADVIVASPAIEVSLQDGNDATIVKRVLLVSETGLPSIGLAARSEQTVTLPLALQDATGGPAARVAGYRVLAFYP